MPIQAIISSAVTRALYCSITSLNGCAVQNEKSLRSIWIIMLKFASSCGYNRWVFNSIIVSSHLSVSFYTGTVPTKAEKFVCCLIYYFRNSEFHSNSGASNCPFYPEIIFLITLAFATSVRDDFHFENPGLCHARVAKGLTRVSDLAIVITLSSYNLQIASSHTSHASQSSLLHPSLPSFSLSSCYPPLSVPAPTTIPSLLPSTVGVRQDGTASGSGSKKSVVQLITWPLCHQTSHRLVMKSYLDTILDPIRLTSEYDSCFTQPYLFWQNRTPA